MPASCANALRPTIALLACTGSVVSVASSWLVSPMFGLDQARSLEAEQAIEAAEAWMRGIRTLPKGLDSKKQIHASLQRLLPALDEFWPRWVVKTQLGNVE